jgi:electron transfer flavoprotein beta subunit
MNVAVCLKQVPDTAARLKLNSDTTDIDREHLNEVINPYDEYALEEAIKLKDNNPGTRVVVFSIANDTIQSNLRKALAMGADEAVQIIAEVKDAYGTALVLTKAINEVYNGKPDLVCMGKEATDTNRGETGVMMAELMSIPCFNSVVSFEKSSDSYLLESELLGGLEHIEAKLPFVFTAQKGLNQPRVPNMKSVMMARKKTINTMEVSLEQEALVLSVSLEAPTEKKTCQQLGSVEELLSILKNKIKVI